MTISTKIIGGYIAVLALLIIVAAAGFYSLTTLQDSYSEFIEVDEKLIGGANRLRFELIQQTSDYRAFLLYPREQAVYLQKLREGYREFDIVIEEMRERVITEAGRDLLEEIANLQMQRKQMHDQIIALAQERRQEEAIALNQQALPMTQELMDKVEEFRARERQFVAEERTEVRAMVNRNSILTVIISLLAIILGLGIGVYLSRSITRQFQDSTAQLSTSSAEILAVTNQVASGAAETATAVNETTTTVEEVKQTALLSSQKAKHVSEQAQKAAQVAQNGTRTVEDTIEGMQQIREQMASIAESIVGLSEQSQTIGEIITTVNTLAEQSNLLAVNAAIEAAKAGEHGKGFAVVAHEVKSLAEQSRQATAQVREILGDIQKGTTHAVMATEQGSKAVEAGVIQARTAGESINALADSIMETAQAALQIAASSQQQLVGMDQMALAMENIRQATTQNVTGAKQVESAARDLNELSQRLKQAVQGSPA